METLLEKPAEKKGFNKGFILGGMIGLVIIGIAIWLLSMQPSMEDQRAAVLAGSYTEGTPEFEQITKDLIISTDDNTVESPNAVGTISMYISGKIRNKGNRVINGLEVRVAVVDRFEQVLKEKRVLVVPTQQATLGPGEVIPITLTLDGFDRRDDRANIRWKVTAIRPQA